MVAKWVASRLKRAKQTDSSTVDQGLSTSAKGGNAASTYSNGAGAAVKSGAFREVLPYALQAEGWCSIPADVTEAQLHAAMAELSSNPLYRYLALTMPRRLLAAQMEAQHKSAVSRVCSQQSAGSAQLRMMIAKQLEDALLEFANVETGSQDTAPSRLNDTANDLVPISEEDAVLAYASLVAAG